MSYDATSLLPRQEVLHLIETSRDLQQILDSLREYFEKCSARNQILITLDGENFDGAISGDFAKGLVAIQENFYRYCALVLHGKDDIKLLGKDKSKYTLRKGKVVQKPKQMFGVY